MDTTDSDCFSIFLQISRIFDGSGRRELNTKGKIYIHVERTIFYREKKAEKKIRELKLHLHLMRMEEKKYMKKNKALKEQIHYMTNYVESIMEDL